MIAEIQVAGPTDQLVPIYRGVDRETYSCMPICQRRVTLGDGDSYFKSVMDQAGSLSNQAAASAANASKANSESAGPRPADGLKIDRSEAGRRDRLVAVVALFRLRASPRGVCGRNMVTGGLSKCAIWFPLWETLRQDLSAIYYT